MGNVVPAPDHKFEGELTMEEFANLIKSLARRVEKLKASEITEEATKTSVIMPFFQGLGYDVFNPDEFYPEFTADVGIKKGEKVDYAILQGGTPLILVEAKSLNEKLDKHDSQLYRYFGTSPAKFGILTNGVIYRFYTDLEELNKMDARPFLEFDITDIRDNQLTELAKFRKSSFDLDNILTTASDLKYTSEIRQFLSHEMEHPTDEFVAFVVGGIYPGRKTRGVLDKFHELVKKSFRQLVNDAVSDKLKSALANYSKTEGDNESNSVMNEEIDELPLQPEIVTTQEEIEGYVLIRMLLRDTIDQTRVVYRDNHSYFNVLLDDNIRKWLCRLGLHQTNKYIQLHDDARTTYQIQTVSDIEKYKDEIIKVVQTFI